MLIRSRTGIRPRCPDRRRRALFFTARFLRAAAAAALWGASPPGTGAEPSAPAVFYVSPRGRDTWSGRTPAANANGTDGPFASLERARDVIRALKKRTSGAMPPVTVFVRGGVYALPRTFQLRREDSGRPGAPVLYAAYRDEKPVLSGGRRITGFTPYRDGILKADLRAQGFPKYRFKQLFFNGKRQHLARYPNFDPTAPICGGWLFVPGDYVPLTRRKTVETLEQRRTFRVRPRDLHRWTRPTEGTVMVFPHHNWWNHIVPIAGVDYERGTVRLGADRGFDARLGDRRFGMKGGDRFYFRGLFEELDAPGEWYLDPRTWTLYFIPPGPMSDATVTVPAMNRVLDLQEGVRYVTFRGFTIECSDKEAVSMYKTDHCRLEKCVVRNVMEYNSWSAAVRISGTNNSVTGCDVYSVGSTGIFLGGGDFDTLEAGNNTADNNYIHHTGVFYKAGSGISCTGVGNRVSHNLIHDTPRQGIRWNGNDHVIEYNHLRHTNTEISDTAAINACNTSWTKRGTIIQYNYIHDPVGFGWDRTRGWVAPYYCWGIYLDNITCGVTIRGNIMVRVVRGGPFIHGGRDNLIENNIIVDGGTTQMTYSSWKPDPGKGTESMKAAFARTAALPAYRKYPQIRALENMPFEERLKMAGNRFVRNIICYRGDAAALYSVRNLDTATTESDSNVIWHFDNPLLVRGLRGVPPERQWSAWKALGFERRTVVADPRFVDAEHGDYRLRPDSPARRIGFRPIPVDKIGPYKSPLRATWPIVEAQGVREHPLQLDRMPGPPPKPARPRPTFRVPRLTGPITVDGAVLPAEWNQVNMQRGITLKEDPRGAASKPVSFAHLGFDDEALYVAFVNRVSEAAPLKTDAVWNRNDAVEVAFRTPSGTVFVLRGYPKGQFESSTEAGAPIEAARRLQTATRYGARIVNRRQWTAEWRIPFAALGIDPKSRGPFDCNLTVRKTATDQWLMWHGTGGASWQVSHAGRIVFGREQ
ncbi:MAG: hypothetical protein GXP31_02980 [Kiritimatiellaeota bacterium]|nr:hypothetical protein [Kiritimatiellota bacterium]